MLAKQSLRKVSAVYEEKDEVEDVWCTKLRSYMKPNVKKTTFSNKKAG